MVHTGHAPLCKYLLPVHDAQLAVACVGQALPVAPVPPEHVQTFIEQSRLRVVVGDVASYSASEHVLQARHAPLLKYLLPVHDTHLGPLLVHAAPVAGDPLLHVHE